MAGNPTAFVCHSSATHRESEEVYKFTNSLREKGIHADLDIYHQDNPPPNWVVWREKKMEESNYVIFVLTKSMFKILSLSLSSDQPLQNHVIALCKERPRCVVLCFLNTPVDSSLVPPSLKGGSLYGITLNEQGIRGDDQFTKMYSRITCQSVATPASVGQLQPVPAGVSRLQANVQVGFPRSVLQDAEVAGGNQSMPDEQYSMSTSASRVVDTTQQLERPSSSTVELHRFEFRELLYDKTDVQNDRIGRGGYGIVHKATTESHGIVAVKVLDCNREDHRLVQKEVKLLQIAQGHENIVKIIGDCLYRDTYCIVLEFVEGDDLETLTLETQNQTIKIWKNRIDVTSQIAKGLRHLHGLQNPIIHHDLKPRNILVKEDQSGLKCKITDFGISKLRGVASQTRASTRDQRDQRRRPTGTAAFIAPERYTPGFNVSENPHGAKKADIFSLGMVMWQIHALERPFKDDPGPSIVEDGIRLGNRPSQQPVSGTPPGYWQLITECWDKDPLKRPAPDDIIGRLQGVLT